MGFVCENSLRNKRMKFVFKFQGPVVAVCTATFNIETQYVLQTDCVYRLCMDIRINSDYFPIHH